MCEFCKHIGNEQEDLEIKTQDLRNDNGILLFRSFVSLDDIYRKAYNKPEYVDLKIELDHETSDGPFMTQRIQINYCPMCGRNFKDEEA